MTRNPLASEIVITTGGAYDIGITDGLPPATQAPFYELTGSPNMVGNFGVTNSTITAGEKFTTAVFHNVSSPTLNGNHVSILGTQVPDKLIGKEFWAFCVWNGNQWFVVIVPDLATDGIISVDMLEANAVIADKIAALAVTTAKIADLGVTEGKIAAGAVTADKIGALSVGADKIAADAVTTTKINNLAVTEAKIDAGAVTVNKIGALAVTADKIAANAITSTKIAAGAVTADKIAAGTFGAASLAADAVETAKIAALAVTDAKLAADAVVNAKIAAGAVTVNKVATGLKMHSERMFVPVITYAGVNTKLRIPAKCQLTNIHTSCVITMDNTAVNYERILFQNHLGNNMAGSNLAAGKLTFPDGFAAGSTYASTVTGNNSFEAGEELQITCEKNVATTGAILLSLEFTLVE